MLSYDCFGVISRPYFEIQEVITNCSDWIVEQHLREVEDCAINSGEGGVENVAELCSSRMRA
jgi:hypothetical protein